MDAPALQDAVHGIGLDEGPVHEDEVRDGGAEADDAAGAAGQEAAAGPPSKSDAQRQYRNSAVKFVSWSLTYPIAIVARICIGPVCCMMHDGLKIASARWEMRQAAGAAKGRSRAFKVTMAARHEAESKASRQLEQLFTNPDPWRLLPLNARTVEVRSMAFRMLSCQGCLLKEHHFEEHSNYPYATFLMLDDAEGLAAAFGREACHKRFDPWTQEFYDYWSNDPMGAR